MIKRTFTIIFVILAISLSGCSKDEINDNEVVSITYSFNESFTKLKVKHEEITPNINIQTDEIFQIELEQENQIKIPNENEQYKDIIESNIEINEGEIDINFDNYKWFTIPADASFDYYGIYQYIIYGIDKYYNGSVTEAFTSNIPDDIFDETTNMIFKVRVQGEKTKLVLSIDMYNNNIKVEEVKK